MPITASGFAGKANLLTFISPACIFRLIMSAIERFAESVKGFFPAEQERRHAKEIADRFDVIKTRLKELKVEVFNNEVRDNDHKFIKKVTLRFNKKQETDVRELLYNVGIEEVEDRHAVLGRITYLGIMAQAGEGSKKHLKQELDSNRIVIFKGKNINQDDYLRLVTLDPKAEV